MNELIGQVVGWSNNRYNLGVVRAIYTLIEKITNQPVEVLLVIRTDGLLFHVPTKELSFIRSNAKTELYLYKNNERTSIALYDSIEEAFKYEVVIELEHLKEIEKTNWPKYIILSGIKGINQAGIKGVYQSYEWSFETKEWISIDQS